MGLLSHMFMHGDFFHILGNMIVLWAFACSLESGLGAATLLGLYLFWGVASGGCHAYMNIESEMPLVGASGAISGLMGAYLVAYGPQANIKCLVFIAFRPFVANIPAMGFCAFWIMGQLWEASNDPNGISGIAWYAHLGGFAVGVVTMFLLRNDMDNELVRDKDGKLKFAENQKVAAAKQHEKLTEVQASPTSRLPENCPRCSTPIREDLVINAMMARCANESCEHLIYPQQLVC
jgi:membrane associated rhomboid family serine protease